MSGNPPIDVAESKSNTKGILNPNPRTKVIINNFCWCLFFMTKNTQSPCERALGCILDGYLIVIFIIFIG